jgi:hypothetical protein
MTLEIRFWCNNVADATREWVLRSVQTEDITPAQDSKPPGSIGAELAQVSGPA